jgi:hypothetical protein
MPRYLKHAGPGLRDGRICVLMLRIGYSGASSSNKLTRRVLGKNRKPMDQAPNSPEQASGRRGTGDQGALTKGKCAQGRENSIAR